jgi:hypothetical protein
VQSTTVRSAPRSVIDLTGSPAQISPLPKRHDPPNVWTVPFVAPYASMRRARPDREDNHGAGRNGNPLRNDRKSTEAANVNENSCVEARDQTTGRIARLVARTGNACPLTTGVGGKRPIGGLDSAIMLEPLGSDLWFADGGIVSFHGFDYPTRMAIVRLVGGGLWLWSPVEKTDAVEDEIRALGPVRHIVSPNKLHYLFLDQWQAAFPDAKLWGTAETIAKCGDLRFSEALAEDPPADWDGQIDQFYFTNSPFLDELIFFHRASSTVIIADLSQTFSGHLLA